MDDLPPPEQKWVLTPESFNRLLFWLHPDRNQAAVKHEEIRNRLIRRFRQLGRPDPEELTNKTIDRVAGKLPEIIATYEGKREPYFFKVAYNIFLEDLRKPVVMPLPDVDFPDPDLPNLQDVVEREILDACLKHCLEQLHPNSREMIREYYRGARKDKIRSRQELAERLGIKLTNLRLRAQRVRKALRECILECMERKAKERPAVVLNSPMM